MPRRISAGIGRYVPDDEVCVQDASMLAIDARDHVDLQRVLLAGRHGGQVVVACTDSIGQGRLTSGEECVEERYIRTPGANKSIVLGTVVGKT